MPIISRSINESVLIGEEIEVKVVRMDEEKVFLEVFSPLYLAVTRKELKETADIILKKIKNNDKDTSRSFH